MRGLESVTLLQLLPSLDGAWFDTHHVLPSVLGLEISNAVGLLNPGVENDRILEVVSQDTEPCLATLGDDERVAGALGGCVDTISLASECDGVRLCLDLETVDLVDVFGVFESSNLDICNILATAVSLSYVTEGSNLLTWTLK